jgi:hypothetical protein
MDLTRVPSIPKLTSLVTKADAQFLVTLMLNTAMLWVLMPLYSSVKEPPGICHV